jgi:N-acetylneuraminate synthase
MDKEDLKIFWNRWERTQEWLGNFEISALPEEEPARKNARRSLVAARTIAAGKIIEESDLTWKRPAHGISPKFMVDLIGKKATHEISEDTVLQWKHFD